MDVLMSVKKKKKSLSVAHSPKGQLEAVLMCENSFNLETRLGCSDS